ncbi:MAG: hypothetical protein ABJL18_00980 [Hyphomicrobiales bacterium]
MPEFTCYTLRHFMASRCRRTEAAPPREQRSLWPGHSKGDTTSRYEQFDPDYLEETMMATDEIIGELDQMTARNLRAPTAADNIVRIA